MHQLHQSLWDLKLTLAESGTQMTVGCSVNDINQACLSHWWCPGQALSDDLKSLAQTVLLDITEAKRLVPSEYTPFWRAASGAALRPAGTVRRGRWAERLTVRRKDRDMRQAG